MKDHDPILKENISSYGMASVLKNLSLAVQKGESLFLLGANGCGKSTLLKILSGLLFSRTGKYFAFDREINEKILLNDDFGIYFRASVGVLFQCSDVQLFNPTVEEEIAFGPRQIFRDNKQVQQKVQQIMERLGIILSLHHLCPLGVKTQSSSPQFCRILKFYC
jgi:cobalt/nickel transport system ATP-binding protein